MIRIENIREIPKYMLDRIKKLDKTEYPKPDGHNRFYTYYTKFKNELCSVTVAVRHQYKKWYCKQVVVHGIHNDKVLLRDITMAMGFIKIGWYREGLTKTEKWQDYDWGYNQDKYFQMDCATIVNPEYILTLPQYKYSAVDKYEYKNKFHYLRFYEKYPQCEYLVKAGLSKFATSVQILKKCLKDKQFCKWLYKNKDEISSNKCYIPALISAYKRNKPIKEVQRMLDFKKHFSTQGSFTRIKEMFGDEVDKLLKYLAKQDTDGYCYNDYLNACLYLNLDMNEEKNRYPHDFKRWHDIRIDQYHTTKAEKDKQERKKLYNKFEKVAKKYAPLERLFVKDDYICIIALSPSQLIYEGEQLNHCVGRMNYDQKFAREESLIFFIRNRLAPNTPLVTLEYSIKNKKILQCYGYGDTKPAEDILHFANKVWLPYANRKLKKIA